MTIKQGKQRVVRPELYRLPRYTSLSHVAFRLLVGGMDFADDMGNLDCHSELLAAALRMDQTDVVLGLKELFGTGILRRYVVGGHEYGAIEGWNIKGHALFQTTHHKHRSAWRNPTPEDSDSKKDEHELSRDRQGRHEDDAATGDQPRRLPKRVPGPRARVVREHGTSLVREEGVVRGGLERRASDSDREPARRGTTRGLPQTKPRLEKAAKPLQKATVLTKDVTPTRTKGSKVRGGKIDVKAWQAAEGKKRKKAAEDAPFREVMESRPSIKEPLMTWMNRISSEKNADKRMEFAQQAHELYPHVEKFEDMALGLYDFGD